MNKEITDLETVKNYLCKMFLDKSTAFANNERINSKSELQSILIGEMMCISEIKRIIEYLEGEKANV